MLVMPDLSNVKENVTPGTYKVRITGSKCGEWNNDRGTTRWVNWEMQTFGEDEAKNNGRYIFHRTPIEGGAAFKFRDFYKAATKAEYKAGTQFDTEQLLGKELVVTVDDGVNKEGSPTGYAEVKAVKPI